MSNQKYAQQLDETCGVDETANSAKELLIRSSGMKISKSVRITGTGALTANVLQLTGTVNVISQWALLTSITTLVNATGVYSSLWDGTVPIDLTADGIVLSGAPVGSFFTKDQVAAQTYSSNIADQGRLLETLADRWAGRPFIVTQKAAADTFIRFHLTTTDAPVDFTMLVFFEYLPMDGGTLAFL